MRRHDGVIFYAEHEVTVTYECLAFVLDRGDAFTARVKAVGWLLELTTVRYTFFEFGSLYALRDALIQGTVAVYVRQQACGFRVALKLLQAKEEPVEVLVT